MRCFARLLLGLGLGCLLGATALDGQAPGALAERLQGRVPREVARVVLELAEQARGRGLPVDPLVQKAIEGAAKGVPAERVNAALRAVAAQLDAAALALQLSARPGAAPDTVVVAAGGFALNAGLSTEQLTELAAVPADGAGGLALALRVAGTLAALGVPPTDAVALVVASLDADRSPAELLALPGNVQAEIARGATPGQAAAGLARAAAAQAGRRGGDGTPPARPQPPPRPARPRP